MTMMANGGGNVARSSNNSSSCNSSSRQLLKSEAHRVLADQLSRGRLAPKAKFRADDEISIGEPMATTPTARNSDGEGRLGPRSRRESSEDDGQFLGPASSDSPRQQQQQQQQLPVQPPLVSGGSPERKQPPGQPDTQGIVVVASPNRNNINSNNKGMVASQQRSGILPPAPGGRGTSSSSSTAGKSASLDNYYCNSSNSNTPMQSKLQSVKSSGVTLFQRLSSLRLSFNSHDRRGGGINKITPHLTESDSGFFAGIAAATEGGKRRPLAPYEVSHGPNLVIRPLVQLTKAPPKRRRPKRRGGLRTSLSSGCGERSLSFTDAQFIAQAVMEGDTKLIEELYPNFPASSDPIYTVIKKNRRPRTSLLASPPTALVRPNFLADFADGQSSSSSTTTPPNDRTERQRSSCGSGTQPAVGEYTAQLIS